MKYKNNLPDDSPTLCSCPNEFWQDNPYPYDCPVCGRPTTTEGV